MITGPKPHPVYRILIVEDEFLIAMDMEMQLLRLGHDVVGTADTGEEALSLAETERPDVVLVDVSLRGPMDGVEAAVHLRQVRPVPVVFVTAFGNEDLLRRLRAVSSYEVLMKPYRPEDLQRVIVAALEWQGASSSNPQS